MADPASFAPVPEDWSILIADVNDSAGAIRAGRYKDVNMLSASVLAGVFNALGTIDIPFIFGGDGAMLVLPSELVNKAVPALRNAAEKGPLAYGISMRTGVVPLRELYRDGFTLGLARLAPTGNLAMAAFAGEASAEAERRVKDEPERYATPRLAGDADISGLECRWQGIRSPGGVMLSLMVRPQIPGRTHEIIDAVLKKIGTHHPDPFPVSDETLSISTDAHILDSEHRLKHAHLPPALRRLSLELLRAHTATGRFMIEKRLRFPGVLDLSRYKYDVVHRSDHRKFDGTLRLVLATDPARLADLTDWLEARHRDGELAYGVHTDSEAIMTCVVYTRREHHLHFIDVNNGGYADAAEELKRRMTVRRAG